MTAPSVTADDIVAGLRDHVWTLVRAGKVDAAMVLLDANLDAFMAATMAEVTGRIECTVVDETRLQLTAAPPEEEIEGEIEGEIEDDEDPDEQRRTAVAVRPPA